MIEHQFWGAVLRVMQAMAQASPFILTGLVITAVFRRLLGQANVRYLFGEGTWRSLPQAWAMGMLLPVCSLGVIPIVREMKRAGLSGGTILAFGLTAPLFNPLSVLYGLTLSEPFTIFAFMLASLVVVTCIGLLFDHFFPDNTQAEPEPTPVRSGIKRVLAVLGTMCRECWSRSTLYILVGLSGLIVLSVVLPKASFQSSVNADNPWAPLLMTFVAVPAYATPMLAMSQLGSMFQHGNSVGAAFALLILGAGLNFGIILWMFHAYGGKRALAWMGILLGVVLGLGYSLEKPLTPTDIEVANHTHAFDVYCCPYAGNESRLGEETWRAFRNDLRPEESISLYALLAAGLLGLGWLLLERRWDLERWLSAIPEEHARGVKLDFELPNWILGATAIVALFIMSIAMCFAYYPPPGECLDEMYIVKGEVLSSALSQNHAHALHWLPVWEDWIRRLQVGVYLRKGKLSDYHRMKARVVQNELELLEHAMEDDERDEIRQLTTALSRSQLRLSRAYREEL